MNLGLTFEDNHSEHHRGRLGSLRKRKEDKLIIHHTQSNIDFKQFETKK